MANQSLVLVLAEDDDGHAQLIQRNLKRAGVVNRLIRVRDGQEALDLIHGCHASETLPIDAPILLLLDINMPRLNGADVLRILKNDPQTSHIPVIMLTTTDDPREVERCYQLGCSVYITKPVRYDAFVEALERLGLFLEIVKVPRIAPVSP